MSQILRIFFVVFLIGASLLNADAQTTGKKKFVKPVPEEEKTAETKSSDPKKGSPKQDEEPKKLGFGVNLGNIGFTGDAVNIGLDPNVAYRFSNNFAAGFMVKMNYYHSSFEGYPSYTSFDWGPTIFARMKPLLNMENATPFMQGIFLQAEYERSFVSREAYDDFGNLLLNDEGTKIQTVVNEENYLYIGGGLSSGYPFSSFISYHFNLLDEAGLSRNPGTFRIGFTWNY